jgi:Zn-dependent peptidase ImmA (M78 family)/DNA-binding XRE family transcriptional regulator
MIENVSSNLRRLRALNGLNQGELAQKAGISRNAYRAIETGAAVPREGNIQRLAGALGVSSIELFREVPRLATLRFRSNKAKSAQQEAEREEIVHRVAIWLQDFNELEEELGLRPVNKLKGLVGGESNPRRMAERARTDMHIPADAPINDICDAIEDAGIKLMLTSSRSDIFFGLSVGEADQGPAIVINVRPEIPVERQIFSTAHELGHLLMHPDSYTGEFAEESPDVNEEKEANQFASYLLMPKKAFEEKWEEYAGLHFVDRVLKIKRHFLVSYLTVLRRLIEEHGADRDIMDRFRDLYEQRYGKKVPPKSDPFPLAEPDFREDRLDLLVRKAWELEKISTDRAAEILGISLKEMRARIDSWSAAR